MYNNNWEKNSFDFFRPNWEQTAQDIFKDEIEVTGGDGIIDVGTSSVIVQCSLKKENFPFVEVRKIEDTETRTNVTETNYFTTEDIRASLGKLKVQPSSFMPMDKIMVVYPDKMTIIEFPNGFMEHIEKYNTILKLINKWKQRLFKIKSFLTKKIIFKKQK